MPRVICPTCQRPEKVCLCHWIQPIENRVEVVILQHPTEVSQIKGTAKIAKLSLLNSHLWIGEDFTEERSLKDWLNQGQVFILYPETEALKERSGAKQPQSFKVEEIRSDVPLEQVKLLVLDGTWRKTHKMMMQNAFLHPLNRMQLQPETPSNYQIRKQKDQGSLSTVEAIYQALSQLEQNPEKFQPLINAFDQMIRQQLAFRK
ncbi:MAG: tRNA-uridine aminocarboxypropyltransferase [Pseudomonadota bacterium]|nr:tRNA-uridine aminocarboxypropyltransferase [Pseudomonadota bacterium]